MHTLKLYDGRRPNRDKQRGDSTVVYALVDPRDGAVRYIGITNSLLGRFKEHMRMYEGNERKNAWLRGLLDAHLLPLMHTFEVVEVEEKWRDREIAWIQTHKESGADLLNNEIYRFEGVAMEEIRKDRQPTKRLRLPDLPDYRLGVEGDLNGLDSTDLEFLTFVQTLVPLTGENLEHWTWEERRDFLNWCLDEQVLTIQNGRLVPFEDEEEKIPTSPLPHGSEALSSAAEEEN